MPVEFYKLLHVSGMFLLFCGLGSMLLGKSGEGAKPPKLGTILHGLGLLAILVAGFGLMARLGFGWQLWLILKIVVWVLLGAMPILVRKKIVPPALGWIVALALGVGAAYCAFYKPFVG